MIKGAKNKAMQMQDELTREERAMRQAGGGFSSPPSEHESLPQAAKENAEDKAEPES